MSRELATTKSATTKATTKFQLMSTRHSRGERTTAVKTNAKANQCAMSMTPPIRS